MAVLVSELTYKTGPTFLNTDRVLVVDPTTQDLYVVAAAEFRGSSVFVSANAPTTTPEDPNISVYKSGDVFYQKTEAGIQIYHWDEVNTQWIDDGRLDGSRIWTQEDIGVADLDESVTVYDNSLFDDGDFYYNKQRGIMYGPYNRAVTTGFDFGTTDYELIQHIRGIERFEYVDVGAQGYHRPENNIPTLEKNLNNKAWLPRHGDQMWVKKGGTNGHGGYVYTFDVEKYKASTEAQHADKLADGWGYIKEDIGGGTVSNPDTPEGNSSRRYYRDASLVVSNTGAPTWNTDEYRDGDSVLDPTATVIFKNFHEFLDPANDDTTDLGVVFDSQESLQGSAILSDDIVPVRDDALYKSGEFLITTSLGTARLHGPYEFGAVEDVAGGNSENKVAWPLASVMRPPYEHHITAATYDSGNGLLTDYTGDDYPEYNGVMVVPGDTMTIVYGPNKEVTLSDGVIIDDTAKTLNWGPTLTHRDPHQTHVSTISGRPSADDSVYYSGDLFKNSVGDVYGPYVEGQTDDSLAWPKYYSLAPTKYIEIEDAFTLNYMLPTANESAIWGNAFLSENDIVRVNFTGSTRNKHFIFKVQSLGAGDTIVWQVTKPESGKTIYSTGFASPARDDASYYAGDLWVSGSGIAYSYVEGQSVDTDAWVFSHYVRSPETFELTSSSFDGDTTTYPTTQITGSGKYLIKGDKYIYTHDTTGKSWVLTVDTVDHVAKTIVWDTTIVNAKPPITYSVNTSSVPVANDNLYSDGDYAINNNNVMYGPYSTGEATADASWPEYSTLNAKPIMQDTQNSDQYEYVIEDGVLYLNKL